MDHKPHQQPSDRDLGITIVFVIVLISALLLARYDTFGWLPNLLESDAQQVERAPIPPGPPL